MQIDWPRYVKTAKEQGLTGIEVVRLIQKETNRKVNISEVKRRLAGTESSTLGFEADTVDVIDLIEEDLPQETKLRVNANGMTFEFRTSTPEDHSSSRCACHTGYITDRPAVRLPPPPLHCTRPARN